MKGIEMGDQGMGRYLLDGELNRGVVREGGEGGHGCGRAGVGLNGRVC